MHAGKAKRILKVHKESGAVPGTSRARYDAGDLEIEIEWYQRDISGGEERRTFKAGQLLLGRCCWVAAAAWAAVERLLGRCVQGDRWLVLTPPGDSYADACFAPLDLASGSLQPALSAEV